MKLPALTSLLVLLLAACTTGSASSTTTSPPSSSTTASGGTTTPTTSPPTTAPGGCATEDAPIAEGEVAAIDQPSADAEQIGAITWETNAECENFVIDFVTAEGAPATTPPSITATMLREVGLLRVEMDLSRTAITDQLVQSVLVERLYVVRQLSPDGPLFVDFHLTGAALASVTVGTSPGQLLVALEPGGSPYPATPAIAENVVLVTPTEGPVDNPVAIEGYSRNFEANTVARIEQGNQTLAEGFTTAADWVETWGAFRLDLNATGSGEADLFVGEQSAQDGSDRGIRVAIELP
jgi:hypothetical protein